MDLLAEVTRLGSKGETGILTVDAGDWATCRVYLMGGDIIAANEDDTNARLGSLLQAVGAVGADTLESVSANANGGDLGDLLVRGKHVSGADLMTARAQLFRDAFLWASGAESPSIQFDSQDAVFPDNMQFGVDRSALVDETKGWLKATKPARKLIRDAASVVVANGDRPEAVSQAAWERLQSPLGGMALLDALDSSREAGMQLLASLLADGRLGAPDEEDDLIELDSVDPLDPEGADPIELDVDEEVDLEDDYERAKRGDFIKSYEVLDKVDLSGVAVLGADVPDVEIVALELGDGDEAVALGGDDEDDELDDGLDDVLAAIDDPPLDTAPQLARLHQPQPEGVVAPTDDDFAMFDSEDIAEDFELEAESGLVDLLDEDEAGLVELHDEDESGVLVTGDQIDLAAADSGPFGRVELAAFHERINIFNNIFRIIFRTFSEHIGPDNSLQRFNALLSSNQRQYPELFADILVADDGSVQPAPLIRNLANCTASDHGSLLHQGLYELIFSHLYDAKDMLPGDVESGMMEQILVFERQLHQG